MRSSTRPASPAAEGASFRSDMPSPLRSSLSGELPMSSGGGSSAGLRIAGVSRHERGSGGSAASHLRPPQLPPPPPPEWDQVGEIRAVAAATGRERTVLVPMRMAADGTMSRV